MGYLESFEEDLNELQMKIDSLCDYFGIELIKSRRTIEEMRELYKKTNNPYQEPKYYKVINLKDK